MGRSEVAWLDWLPDLTYKKFAQCEYRDDGLVPLVAYFYLVTK